MGIDTAPFVALIAFTVVLSGRKIPTYLALIIFFITIGFLADILFGFNVLKVKNYIQYIFCFVTILYFQRIDFGVVLTPRLLSTVVCIYLLVGLMQLFSFNWVSDILVPSSRGIFQLGRGVCSLTSEPSFYATILILLLLLVDGFESFRTKNLIILLILFQIVFLARSALGFIFLGLFFSLKFPKLTTVTIVIVIMSGMGFIHNIENGSRVMSLFLDAQNNGILSLVASDQSVANRLMRLYGPLYALVADYGIPHFYSGWTETTIRAAEYIGLDGFMPDDNDRISGGILPVLYHYGIFGLAALVALLRNLNGRLYFKVTLLAIALSPIIIFNPVLILVWVYSSNKK